MKLSFRRLFTSGYWVIAFLVLVTGGLIVKRIVIPWHHGEFTPIVGDSRHVASYGFNLSPCLVSRRLLVASGNPKDALPALIHPALLTVAQVEQINAARRDSGGFIENASRVIGVVIHGHARAYPLAILNWHAVINDTLGNVPLAVTYDGFCGSALVFNRRVSGYTLHFGYSGLVYNSNALLYDHEASAAGESLFSQISGRAIAGPAAAKHLELPPLPCQLVTWGDWKSMYPHTTMIAGVRKLYSAYSRDPYATYFADPGYLHFPVSPLWRGSSLDFKSPLILLWIDHHWHPLAFRDLFAKTATDHLVHLQIAGTKVVLQCRRLPQWRTVALLYPPHIPVAYSFLFAWYAQHPNEFTLYRRYRYAN